MIIPWIYRLPKDNAIYVAFINNADCPNRFSVDGHPSASKFLHELIEILASLYFPHVIPEEFKGIFTCAKNKIIKNLITRLEV